MNQLPPTVLLEPPLIWQNALPRSCVTHAVLGSEATGLHSLPAELLTQTFQMLDPVSLCRLAQASKTCQSFADDPLVWVRSQGHLKAVGHARHTQACQLRAEADAAEAAELRQQWRLRKRRVLRVLEVVCGVIVICCAMLFSSRGQSRKDDQMVSAAPANKSVVTAAAHTLLPVEASRPPLPAAQMRHIVWKAAAST